MVGVAVPAAALGLGADRAAAATASSARTAASAPESSAGPASPLPTSAPAPPTIDDPGDITTSSARFTGSGTPGDRVRVADPRVPSASLCTDVVDSGGLWECTAAVTSGPAQVFTVFDADESGLAPADAPASDVIVPPTIRTSAPSTGTVTGSGVPGATVTVAVSGSAAVRTAVVGADGTWFVSWSAGIDALPTGTWTMSATQQATTAMGYASDLGSASSSRAVVIDRTAPAAPGITAPTTGAVVRTQPIVVSGTGEEGATVTAYLGSAPVCQAVVADGAWSCATVGQSLPDGTRSVSAGQRDAAGNLSPISSDVTFVVVGAPADDAPSTVPSGSAGQAPSSGASGAPSAAVPGPGDQSTGAAGSDPSDGGSGPRSGTTAGTGNGTGWSATTAFGGAVPTIQSSMSSRTLIAVLIGVVAFLALVAVPLKLLVASMSGRAPRRLTRLTGRNRTGADRADGDDGVPVWATLGIAVGLATVLVLLATGVEAQARYARLAIAVAVGAALLAAGTVLAARWAAGAAHRAVTYRIAPALVLAALVACVVSRSADLSPAIVLGVVIVPADRGVEQDSAAGDLPDARSRDAGRRATWCTGVLLVLVAVGWVLDSAVTGSGFWAAFVGELASTLCVGGIGSLIVTLLPIAGSAGAVLWATSRARYAVLASISVASAVALYSGPTGTHLPAAVVAVAVAGCAAAGVVAWTWAKLVEPVLRS